MSKSSIWLIDRSLSGATTPGQSGPGSNSNEGILCISESSSFTGATQSDCLVSYTRHSLGRGCLPPLQRCSISRLGNTSRVSKKNFYMQYQILTTLMKCAKRS